MKSSQFAPFVLPLAVLRGRLRLLPALLLFVAGAMPARAVEEFYSSPHGADPFPTWASTVADNGFSIRTYDSFQVNTAASITQVTWIGCYIDENVGATAPPTPATTSWRFGFFADNAGEPGALVHSVDVPVASVSSDLISTHVYANGNPIVRRRYTANLPAHAILAPGTTYWFSPLSLQPAYNPHFSWMTGAQTGTSFQRWSQPPQDLIRQYNRAFTLRGEFFPGISLKVGGTTIASGGSHNFGAAVDVGQETSATFTITNTGDGPLTGIAVSIAPPGSSDFRVGSPPSATTLAAGATDTFSVIFSPQAVDARTATLNVTSNAVPSPYVIQLSGTGNNPPVLTVPAEDYFGDCEEGETDIAAFLANHGGAVVEDGEGPVTWTHDYGGTLPECRSYITVTFTATDAGGSSVSTSARFFLLPPSAIWIGPAAGTWPTAAAWSRFPTAALDTYVDLFDFQNSVVTIIPGSSPSVKDLYIGEGDTLAIGTGTSSGGTLEVYGNSISNAGTLRIRTPAAGSGVSILYINGATTLTGTGKVIFTGAGRNRIAPGANSATDVLTVAAGQEVAATGGTVAEYQHTSIHAGLVNHGLVTADGSGLTLYDEPKTNNSTFRAINGGTLRLQAAIDNANGTLFAGAGSTLHLQTTLTGGQVTGTGRLLINSTATLTGPISLGGGLTTAAESAVTDLNGTITNDGLFLLGTPGGGSLANLNINGAVTLQGNGKLVIQGSDRRLIERGNSSAADVLTVAAGQEITTSAGTVPSSQSTGLKAGLVNDGIITADQGGIALTHNAKTNNGTFRAINGGSLIITGSVLTNYNAATDTLTGGRWEVVSEGTPTLIDIQSAPIATIAAGTTVRLSGAGASLPQLASFTNITGTLMLENGKTLATTGNMAIPGVLQYGLPAALETTRLAITGNVNFTGTRVDVLDLDLSTGSYLLASWTGTLTGTPVLGALPPGSQHSLVLNPTAKTLRLEVFVIPQVDITTFTITPGTGPSAGQDVVTFAGLGHPGANYLIEASTELLTWTSVSPVLTSPTGALTWEFTQSPVLRRRYYRFQPQ